MTLSKRDDGNASKAAYWNKVERRGLISSINKRGISHIASDMHGLKATSSQMETIMNGAAQPSITRQGQGRNKIPRSLIGHQDPTGD